MGQNSSQVAGAAPSTPPDSKDDHYQDDPSHFYSNPPLSAQQGSPDLVYSSQVPGSTNAVPHATSPTRRQSKAEFPSSSPQPARLPSASSSQRDTEVEIANMPGPKIPNSSDPTSGTHAYSHKSKKKNRSKKSSSSTSYPTEDRRALVPHPSLDLDAPTYDINTVDPSDEVNGSYDAIIDEADVNSDTIPSNTLSEKDIRRQQKRERKEKKRAAKLAKRQLEEGLVSNNNASLNDYAEESAGAAPPSQEEPLVANSGSPDATNNAANTDLSMALATTDIPPKSSKKRGRKAKTQFEPEPLPESDFDQLPAAVNKAAARHSRKRKHDPNDFDDFSDLGNKKHKGSFSKEPSAVVPKPGEADRETQELVADGFVPESQSRESKKSRRRTNKLNADTGTDFSSLAESLYAGRKKSNSSKNGERLGKRFSEHYSPQDPPYSESQDPSVSSSPNLNGADTDMNESAPEDQISDNDMDVDDPIKSNNALEDDMEVSDHGQNLIANGSDAEDKDEDEDGDEDGMQMDGDDEGDVDFEPVQDHDDDRSSVNEPSLDDAHEDHDRSHKGRGNVGITQHDSPDLDDVGDSVSNGLDYDNAQADTAKDKQVSDDVSDDQVEVPSSVPRPSTRRKRQAKPAFYNGVAEDDINASSELHSPVAAASLRKKSRGNAVAESSKTPAKQPKISNMLKAKSEDSPDPVTPARSTQGSALKKRPKEKATVTGPFSDFEVRNIGEAIARWRDAHGKTQFEVNELIHGNPKDANCGDLWYRITAVCPNRERQKVINQTRRKFHNFVARGTWTEEQDAELKEMWQMHGDHPAIIGRLINRHPEDVRDRIRNYISLGDKRRTNLWTEEEEAKLVDIVREAKDYLKEKRKDPDYKEKDQTDNELIDWAGVSERMDQTRSRLQCIMKWKAIEARPDPDSPTDEVIEEARTIANAMSNRDRYNVIKAILASGANHDSRIPWAKVKKADRLAKKWSPPTLMVVWYRLKVTVPQYDILTVSEIATQLVERYRGKQGLELASEEELDLKAESDEIEKKINRIRKPPKTPNRVVKTDDDDDDDNGDDDNRKATDRFYLDDDDTDSELKHKLEDDDAMIEEVPDHVRDSSVDLGLGMEASSDNLEDASEPEIQDSDPDVQPRHLQTTLRTRGHFDPGSSDHAPSISEFKQRKARRGAKDYGSASKTRRSQNLTPEKSKQASKVSGTPGQASQTSAKKLLAGRRSLHQRSRPQPEYDQVDDQSSNTNASEVESIPAH